MGHIIPPRHLADTAFEGSCPFHGGCLEGLASGPAIVARWGRTLSELGADHPAQDIIAWYLGHLAATLIATFSPRNIVLGGGVMETEGLIDRLRWHAERFSAGYLLPADVIDAIVGKARLGSDVGLHGARLLAERVHRSGV
jgi:fructokinase